VIRLLERLQSIDRRIVFLFVAICVIMPFIFPLRMPVAVGPSTRGLFGAIDSLPEGSVVMLAGDYSPDGMPELQPMTIAMYRHCFRRNLRVLSVCLWPEGPPLIEAAYQQVAAEYDKEYGVDYVNLGYTTGGPNAMVEMGTSIPGLFPRDFYQTPIEELPLMEGITNFSQIAFLVSVSAGTPGTREWVQQAQSRFGVRMGAGVTAVSAPNFYPYMESGQLIGLLGGMAGAAEYETLIEQPGTAARGMDAQSAVHLLIILFVVFGNISYLLARRKKGET
jgi:hypothetical protein